MSKSLVVFIASGDKERLRLQQDLPRLIPQFRCRVVNDPNQIPEFGKLLVFVPWDYNTFEGLFEKLHHPVVDYLQARGNVMLILLHPGDNLIPNAMSVPASVEGFPVAVIPWDHALDLAFNHTDKFTIQGGMRIQKFLLKDLTKGVPSTPGKKIVRNPSPPPPQPSRKRPTPRTPPSNPTQRMKTQESSDEELPAPLPQTQPPEILHDSEEELLDELEAVERERNQLVDKLVKLGARANEIKKKLKLYH